MLRQLCLLFLFSNFTLIANAQAIKWQDALQMNPASVYSLDCSGLKWDSLPQKLFEFVALESLDLSKNKLTFLPEEMKVFTQLQYLKLGKNKLDHFPLVLCQLPKLRELSMERNALRIEFCYCSVFDDCWLKGQGAAKSVPRCEPAPQPTAQAAASALAMASCARLSTSTSVSPRW